MQNLEYSRKNKYYDKVEAIYVDGSSARQLEINPEGKELTEDEQERRRRRRLAAQARQRRRTQRRVRAFVITSAVATSVVMVFLVVAMLNGTVRTNELSAEIKTLESTYDTILSQNDSKEYDIDRAVDLTTIIKTATEKYGMVRGSSEQIVTYKADDSEYIQQMAELPD